MTLATDQTEPVPAALPQQRGRRVAASFPERLARVAGVAVYTSFEAAEPVWRAFEATATGTAFQSFDWLSAWHAHAGAGTTPAIVVVSRQGEPLLLAPLGIERFMGLKRLVFMGGRMADYKAPLLAPDFAARVPAGEFPAMWRQIARALPRHDLAMLTNQPLALGTPLAPVRNPFVELGGVAAPDDAYVFDLPATFDEFALRYRPETRRIDRSKMRKLEASGAVTFRFAETPEECVAMTAEILSRKAAQLAAQGIRSIFTEPGYRDAYLALAALPAGRSLLDVAELRLDGAFLSGSIGHRRQGRTTLMVHTYEAGAYARLSPGRLHLLQLLQASIARGDTVYDLSVGHLPYKESFCDVPMKMRNFVGGVSLAGAAAAAGMRAGLALKRWVKHDPRLMALAGRVREHFGRMRLPAPPAGH
ncbi:MAG: GNAT family N-acetyltransferase [Parvibaculum sp.]|uniref:GNAT family N-acetyltransferase n=1 Tax=Parvibaculum sp. TaxID=2024848 RepID=UPI0027288848|nr:GNAT family N-acetyltransferase [Parvibaculum sp.]MDO8839932.1 GNAT family N-acetyltransferase [Parvibaculum sp.]